jgi:hypothetical protein
MELSNLPVRAFRFSINDDSLQPGCTKRFSPKSHTYTSKILTKAIIQSSISMGQNPVSGTISRFGMS